MYPSTQHSSYLYHDNSSLFDNSFDDSYLFHNTHLFNLNEKYIVLLVIIICILSFFISCLSFKKFNIRNDTENKKLSNDIYNLSLSLLVFIGILFLLILYQNKINDSLYYLTVHLIFNFLNIYIAIQNIQNKTYIYDPDLLVSIILLDIIYFFIAVCYHN